MSVKGLYVSDGNIFLEGVPVPIPKELVRKINDLVEFPDRVQAFKYFWMLCMANPDPVARYGYYKYVETFGIPITKHGYVIMYKQVEKVIKKHPFDSLHDDVKGVFVDELFNRLPALTGVSAIDIFQVESEDIKGVDDFCIYDDGFGSYLVGKTGEIVKSDSLELIYSLKAFIKHNEKYNSLPDYVPFHKGGVFGNDIRLGVPVTMPRAEIDSNPERDCSTGLHVGSYSYVKKFYNTEGTVLACLVNPMNVVAIPQYDHSKIRVSEYYPYAEIKKDELGNWSEIESPFTENEYLNYEKDLLDRISKQLKKTHISLDKDNSEFIDALIKSRKEII